ncbi:MAG TPA: hypothetical protein VN687_00445 [Blastocatellia bacterium]|nr:hypothetical protein [Blastocatellia bacterium]
MTRTMAGSPVRRASRPMRDTSRDWEWVSEHKDEYRGQWVIVYECQLIGADRNIRLLLDRVPREAFPDAIVTYVPTDEEAKLIVL